MTVDWIKVCELADVFLIEEHGKELWLVKHKTDLVDGPVEFPVGSDLVINIPFRPHVLVHKADKLIASTIFSLCVCS